MKTNNPEAAMKELKKVALKIIKKKIAIAIQTDVIPVIKNELQRNIQEQVYNVDFGNGINTPFSSREFKNQKNFAVYFDENNLSLMIRNETKPVSIFEKMGQRQTVIKDNYEGLFGYWIETGRVPVLWDNGNGNFVDANPYFELNYIDSNGVEHTRIIEKAFKPRPFMKETKKSLKSSNKIKDALKKGLKRQGLSLK